MMVSPRQEIEAALEVLDLPRCVTKEDIKRQYRHLARKYHPDLGGTSEKMERINGAYRLLMKYIEEFRYTFDADEISKQFPGVQYAEQFTP